ncbi:MAG: hypothetical protein AAFY48_13175 [Bacteroidota bacterium]
MKYSFVLSLFLAIGSLGFAQEITYLELVPNQTVEFSGDIENGQVIPDLSWAWNSSVACFPETVASKFRGNHVLYMIDIPRYSEMEIKLIPEDESADYSLYAYQAGYITAENTVPNLQRCIRCEADYSSDYRYAGRTQDHTRTVRDILAINNPYQALIVVVGPPGVESGAYKLQIHMKSR